MQPPRNYYVYIVASRTRVLYIGITGNLEKRIWEHKSRVTHCFTSTYRCDRLVWCETYAHPSTAIAREKQIKLWTRKKKLALIETQNPAWIDLGQHWGKPLEVDEAK